MRRGRALALATLVGSALLLGGALLDGTASGACSGHIRCVGVHLPAPITIVGAKASYRIGSAGSVSRIAVAASPYPTGSECCGDQAPGIWWVLRHRHLVVGRWRNTLWRSRGEFAARFGIGAVDVGSGTIAFSYGSNLYLAPLNGAERLIGRAEDALGFINGGLYTISWVYGLLLRSDSGLIMKKIVHWPTGSNYFVAGGDLYFIAHGALMRARGAHVQRLVPLASLGFSADDMWMQQLGPLIALQDTDRLTLVRADGSVFAWTPISGQADTITGLSVAPNASAVAFAAAAEQARAETVYLLRAGANRAVSVVAERNVAFPVCAGGEATLQWHGGWLLYSSSERRLAVIDTTGTHRVIELSKLVAALPGARDGLIAYWSGQPPPF